MPKSNIRDRVVELRKVPANTIKPNPWNWRLHPQNQRDALAETVEDIGFAGALIARETPDGLELVDGHLRQDMFGDCMVPVLIVDMTDEEVRRLLATLDPIGAMAQTDTEALTTLLDALDINGEATRSLLEYLVENGGFEPEMPEEEDVDGATLPDLSNVVLADNQWQVLVDCKNESEQGALLVRLNDEGFACHSLIS